MRCGPNPDQLGGQSGRCLQLCRHDLPAPTCSVWVWRHEYVSGAFTAASTRSERGGTLPGPKPPLVSTVRGADTAVTLSGAVSLVCNKTLCKWQRRGETTRPSCTGLTDEPPSCLRVCRRLPPLRARLPRRPPPPRALPHHRGVSSHVTGLTRGSSRLRFRFCQWEKRNCCTSEPAGDTFLQVLRICTGRAPGGTEDAGQAGVCPAGRCVCFAVPTCWAQDPAGTFPWPLEVRFRRPKGRREWNLHPTPLTPTLPVCHPAAWVHILVDFDYQVTSLCLPLGVAQTWLKGLCFSLHVVTWPRYIYLVPCVWQVPYQTA